MPPQDLANSESVTEENTGNVSPVGDSGLAIPARALQKDEKIPYEVLRLIPQESGEHYNLVPLSVKDGILEVGMVDPENIEGIGALNFITRKTGMPFKVFRISPRDLQAVFAMYEGLTGEVEQALMDISGTPVNNGAPGGAAPVDAGDGPLDLSSPNIEDFAQAAKASTGKDGKAADIKEDAPAIKLASTILRYAIDGKASDIHIEPTSSGVRVRYRVDGTLHTTVVLPSSVHRSLIARIKVLSAIRLDEQRKPQDGRFAAEIDGRKIDFRVSTFPSYYGEKIVIRILDREEGFIPLGDLGMPEDMQAVVREALAAHATQRAAAVALGVSPQAVTRWRGLLAAEGA